MISVTKLFEFEAAHKLEGYNGLCANLHGHSYKLEIEVEGLINEEGFVVDFSILKEIVNRNIIDILDHQNLNEVFTFRPTAENMVLWIAKCLKGPLTGKGVTIIRVMLWETSSSYAEWRLER